MKTFISTLVFLTVYSICFSQDLLILRDGTDISAKILEISSDEIKYKKASNPDGPTYTMDKEFVFMIKYANGDKDVFNAEKANPSTEAKTEAPQEEKPKKEKVERKPGHFFSITGGASIPIGEYASTKNTKLAGFATTGYNANVEGAYFFIPEVGLGGAAGVFGNGIDKTAFNENIYDNLDVPSGYQRSQIKSTIGWYTNVYAAVGPYFQLATKVVNVSINGLIGGMYVLPPSSIVVKFSLSNGSSSYNYNYTNYYTGAFGLAYGGGLDLRFKVSPLISITLGSKFIMSNTEHDVRGRVTVTGSSSYSDSQSAKADWNVGVVNVYGGIAFNLDK